jgi:hypothetical protein
MVYVPRSQEITEENVEPLGQENPAVQGPEHAIVVKPVVAPNRPAAHGPVHTEVFKPMVVP